MSLHHIFKNKKGFSLLEIVITIIILGISLTAILESFIVGSATSVRIANEVTATNLAKQYMADLNYCSEGGTIYGVCTPTTTTTPPNSPFTIYPDNSPQQVEQINNECFYTAFYPLSITLDGQTGTGSAGDVAINPAISPSPDFFLAIVKTEWFNNGVDGGNCTSFKPPAAANYPSVTLTMIFTG
jgi:prepilin-type N-terminal cleavage/methylation domain-containing protein